MAHFAEIDENNIVVRVIVIKDEVLLDENNAQQESLGAAFCQSLYNGTWKQTSDDGTIRKNFAGEGFTFDSTRDAFIPPQPEGNYTLNETTCLWEEVSG